jgi:hypothetical protein
LHYHEHILHMSSKDYAKFRFFSVRGCSSTELSYEQTLQLVPYVPLHYHNTFKKTPRMVTRKG